MSEAGEEAHAAALVGLAGMTPVRLASVLSRWEPTEAWGLLRAGRHPADPDRRFAAPARLVDPEAEGARYIRAGVTVLRRGSARYPGPLRSDPGAPAVLFAHGDPTCLDDRRRVAIVGTRSATPYGRDVASELGRDLAAAGVTVVSGLARGIDGAAHAGALRCGAGDPAPPVAVVGTGLDVVYPKTNGGLWAEIARCGALFSESPLGTQPLPRVFPARNRIIAALSEVVVVVESHHGGGSLTTAEAAARRGIPVCAVPGSVRSRSSEGTNGLLVDGCVPVRDAADVLVAVSLARVGREKPAPGQGTATLVAARGRDRRGTAAADSPEGGIPTRSGGSRDGGRTPEPGSPQRAVWEAVDHTPTTVETILLRSGLSIASTAEACERLVAAGLLRSGAGWWARR